MREIRELDPARKAERKKESQRTRAAAYRKFDHDEKYGQDAGSQRGRHGKQPRGSAHGRWNAGQIVSSHGYVKVRVGISHPLADANGMAYESLVIWVSAGRPRPPRGWVLAHSNDDHADSRIENLELLTIAENNRRQNAKRLRDAHNRLLSKVASNLVRAGASIVTVRDGKKIGGKAESA